MGYAAFRQMMAKRATAASAASASPKATAAATTVPLKPQSERQSASGAERSEYEGIRATLVVAQPPRQNSLTNSSEHKSEHERATAGAEAQFTSDKVVSGSERECASTTASANSETSGIKRKSPPESTELPVTKAARQVRRPSSSTPATAAVPSPHACSEDGGRPHGWSASCGAGYSEFRQKMAANSATAAVPAPPKMQMEVQISSNVEHKSKHESTTATADVNLPGELLGSERKSEHEATAETADAQLSIENHSSIGSEQQSERESAASTAEVHLRGENPPRSGNEHKIEHEATQASANAQLPSETGASGSELDREHNKGREATADAAQMPAENRLSDESERKKEERKSTAASAGVQMPSETIVVKCKRDYDIEITAGSADGHLHSPANSPQATTTTPNPKVRSPEGGGRPAEWSASCGMGYAAFRQTMAAKSATAATATVAESSAATTAAVQLLSETRASGSTLESAHDEGNAATADVRLPSENSPGSNSEHKSEHESAAVCAEAQLSSEADSKSEREREHESSSTTE